MKDYIGSKAMTDKPTPEQIQRACDLANAGCGALHPWFPSAYDSNGCLTALADTIAELDAEKARADKAVADLREIDRMLEGQPPINSSLTDAQAIAAPYRVETDPLVEALVAANAQLCSTEEEYAPILRAELAKRGIEV